MEEKNFVEGLSFYEPREGAPDFIVGRIYIVVGSLRKWLEANNTNSGGINIDVKRSKKGNVYCELNTWKPAAPQSMLEEATIEAGDEEEDSVPF
jgi:hypothetical protein